MKPVKPIPRKERPGKMGFDNDYFFHYVKLHITSVMWSV